MAFATARKWLGPAAGAYGPLAVVVLVELILFIGFHDERWRKSLRPRGDPRTSAGEGLVIRCDGHGYYAWLRSLLIDGDWSFDNEFDDHNPVGDWVPSSRTERGLRSNHWSVGPACFWSLAVVPGHLGMVALNGCGLSWPADGYTLPYQLLVGVATLAASFLGLGFLYGICRHFARPGRAALAAAFLTLGTTIVFYGAIEVTMAHGLGAVAVAGLIWFWLNTYGSNRPGRWLLVGGLVGVAALMRWQLVTFALLPAGECLLACLRRKKQVLGLGLAALGAAVAFLPQVIAWHAVYGHWLVTPVATAHNWLCPSWGQVLTSTDRSLFYWTPLTLLALLGFVPFGRQPAGGPVDVPVPGKGEQAALLLAAFVLQVYVTASLWGEAVQLGVSFGLRHFTESVVALGPGLALLLERAPRRRFLILGGLGCLLVGWNLLLISQYRYGWVPADAGVDPETLLANAVRLAGRKRFLLVGQVLAAPVLLAVLVAWSCPSVAHAPGSDKTRQSV
jgi:hypothetical protein